jgi:hypothetical protein
MIYQFYLSKKEGSPWGSGVFAVSGRISRNKFFIRIIQKIKKEI